MDDRDERRKIVAKRLTDKRDFRNHVVVYLVINTMLVVIWAATGAGYFWPIWPLLGWGVGLLLNAWTVYGQRPVTEDDIRREMRRDDVDPISDTEGWQKGS